MPINRLNDQCVIRGRKCSEIFEPTDDMANFRTTEILFARAVELSSTAERQRFLDEACAGDTTNRNEVEQLLAAHDQGRDFMIEAWSTPPQDGALSGGKAPGSGPIIAGFRTDRRLGAGGLGTVYEAWDEKLQRKVALKVLHAIPNATAGRQVLAEARKTAGLRHPAIVTVHAVMDEHQPPAIVMELVEGFPLDQFAGSLTQEQKVRVLQEVASALAVAHRHGIIHRDLKPGNILLTPALRPVILDFGLALAPGEADELTSGFAGTPLYASPEQVTGVPLTPTSDMFSFGSVMFKLLTGRVPFEGATMEEVFGAIRKATPPFLRDVATRVPADLQAICLACLAADPTERPTAEAVALDLGRFLAGEPVRLRPALYGDILRRRISEFSNDLLNWEHQGIISSDERDRLDVVHRRILADEDHWLVDARRLTLAQTILYTSTWITVLASGFVVWLVREEFAPFWRSALPLLSTGILVAVGLLAEWRKEALAAAAFLTGAVLSLVPAMLAALTGIGLLGASADDVRQLFPKEFTNAQVLVSCFTALVLSALALARLRLTGFAWTSCLLGGLTFISLLLQFDWLGRRPEIQALWTLPLAGFAFIGLFFERSGRVRWGLPFHLVAAVTIIVAFDVMAGNGPTLSMLGLKMTTAGWLDAERLQFLSYALNGGMFLGLMLATENARSLDLRRGSRIFETAAILHLLGALYQNAIGHRGDVNVRVDVGLYLATVFLFLVLGPWLSRWRMLMGALGGIALGSHLLLDLNLIPRKPFVLSLGAFGLVVALSAYVYLVRAPRPRQRDRFL